MTQAYVWRSSLVRQVQHAFQLSDPEQRSACMSGHMEATQPPDFRHVKCPRCVLIVRASAASLDKELREESTTSIASGKTISREGARLIRESRQSAHALSQIWGLSTAYVEAIKSGKKFSGPGRGAKRKA